MAKLMVERYRRGPMGWVMRLLFWGFNVFMLLTTYQAIEKTTEAGNRITEASMRSAYDLGTGLGYMLLLILWGFGALVLGVLSYISRGTREIFEVDDTPPSKWTSGRSK